MDGRTADRVTLRSFQARDLPALVEFWNGAFADRPNFQQLTAARYRQRILDCPAFEPDGLILAWREASSGSPEVVGMVHAFKPAPRTGVYMNWEARHSIALIYVKPEQRSQGVGSRLLQAAENWLYYCPVFVGDRSQPCYGSVEGPRPPLFGSTQHLAISARNTTLIHFLAKRGYRAVEAGDVTLRTTLPAQPPSPVEYDLGRLGLREVEVSHRRPFTGCEPPDRVAFTAWTGGSGDQPYAALALIDGRGLLRAHIYWYPLPAAGCAAIGGFWVAPELRGQGLGTYLLDRALAEMSQAAPRGGYHTVDVLTHLTNHSRAVKLYQQRGFDVVDAWVTLVKT